MQQQQAVVLFPSLGLSNHIPMVELAKVFISHGFSVTYVLINPPFDTSSILDPFISRAASAIKSSSILFHRLPKITHSGDTNPFNFNLVRTASLQLLDYLKMSGSAPTVRALVLDMFNIAGLDVGAELGIPSYIFFPQSAASLAAALALPTLQSQLEGRCSFRDLGESTKISLPGIPPISVYDLPKHVHDRDDTNEQLMSHFERLWAADGFVVNTYEWLDKRAVRALADGDCVPGRRNPPAYCLGPLIADGDEGGDPMRPHECLVWLDAQPEKSVVYISFGTSGGSLSKEQLREIAVGLERSGQRFLWVVRSPDLLPEGFLERTRVEQGINGLVMPWVPQVAVLRHRSVGAFVSHCGWNSSLEAATAGVPVIAWPRGAEQGLNKVHLTEEKNLAVTMEGYDKGVVTASQVERIISSLMDSDEGRAIRDRLAESKAEAAAAWKEGGSSALAWSELVKSMEKGQY